MPISSNWLEALQSALRAELSSNSFPLRYAINAFSGDNAVIEATIVHCPADHPYQKKLCLDALEAPNKKKYQIGGFCVAQIVPTGVCCEFGGFAGDAAPVTNLLASVADYVITHPNAVNASEINESASNVLYVEGRSLDDFLMGNLALRLVSGNRVASLIDPTGEDRAGSFVEVIDAAASAGGIDCDLYAMFNDKVGLSIEWSDAGCAVGRVANADTILSGVDHMLSEGADAVGCVSVIDGVTKGMFEAHLKARLPNPSGGIEAIVTHLISTVFRIPTAHAPLPYYDTIKERICENPRAAAEFISLPHYFSVLKGLSRAPRFEPIDSLDTVPTDLLSLNNIAAVVAPASCLGGIPALAAHYNGIPLIAVRENETILGVTNDAMKMDNVIEVESYLEAAGVLAALKEGIALRSLKRPIRGAIRVEIPKDL